MSDTNNGDNISSDVISELLDKYYNQDYSLKRLIKEYCLNISPSKLVKMFPPEETSYICEYCGSGIVRKRINKDEWNRYKGKPEYEGWDGLLYCPECGHIPFPDKGQASWYHRNSVTFHPDLRKYVCTCSGCREKVRIEVEQREQRKKEELKRKIEAIHALYDYDIKPVNYDSLDFINKVILGALMTSDLVSEDLYYVKPYNSSGVKLSPNSPYIDNSYDSLDQAVYHALHKRGLLLVDSSSDVSAFADGPDFPKVYYPFRVSYHLNIEYPEDKHMIYHKILSPDFFTKDNIDVAFGLWRMIAVYECVEYLLFQIERVGWSFSPGEKTFSVIRELLKEFSVSEIYAIIYGSVTYACRLCTENKMGKKQAANTVISLCRTRADNIRYKGWTSFSYDRLTELPQSRLSSYFFDNVLKIGDKGFTCHPNRDDLLAVLGEMNNEDSTLKDAEEYAHRLKEDSGIESTTGEIV